MISGSFRRAGIANLAVRGLGFARELALAAAVGAGADADALNAALRVPTLFRDLLAEGSLSHAFVPVFARVWQRDGAPSAWALANAMAAWLTLASGAVVATAWLAPGAWTWLVASAFEPDKAARTAWLVALVTPFLWGLSLASLAGGALTVRQRLFTAVAAPGAVSLVVLAAAIATRAVPGADAVGWIALAYAVGGASSLLVQLPALWREGWRPGLALWHPGLPHLAAMLGPAMVAVVAGQVMAVVDTQLAARLGDGGVSQLGYALRLAQMPTHLVGGAVAAAAIASLAPAVAGHRWRDAAEATGRALTAVVVGVAPLSVALTWYAEPLVRLAFERGAFSPSDTVAVASVLTWFGVGAVPFALHRVVVPMVFAWNQPRTAVGAAVAAIVLRVPLAVALSSPASMGVRGLAVAHVVATTVEVVAAIGLLGIRVPGGLGAVVPGLARVLPAVGALVAVCWVGADLGPWWAVGGAGAIAYVAAAWASGALRQAGGWRDPLPPHVPASTRAAVQQMARAPLVGLRWAGGAVVVQTGGGEFTVTARDGALEVEGSVDGELPASGAALQAVLGGDVVPPRLVGLVWGAGSAATAIRAEGDRVVPEAAPGERVKIA